MQNQRWQKLKYNKRKTCKSLSQGFAGIIVSYFLSDRPRQWMYYISAGACTSLIEICQNKTCKTNSAKTSIAKLKVSNTNLQKLYKNKAGETKCAKATCAKMKRHLQNQIYKKQIVLNIKGKEK